MEPRLPSPSQSPEMGSYARPEVPRSPESNPVEKQESLLRGPEKQEAETQTQGSVSAAPIVQLPTPTVVPPIQAQKTIPATDDQTVTANDDDLIEKAWVTKAKQVVQETKDDPYKQENEVSKLQADYLKKRYGKDIKLTNA